VSQLREIYWVDINPPPVMQALGLQMTPSHFAAFMPLELEERLARMELKYMGRKEEQIIKTRFLVIPKQGGGYDIRVESQLGK
jgi:hypothetical protein